MGAGVLLYKSGFFHYLYTSITALVPSVRLVGEETVHCKVWVSMRRKEEVDVRACITCIYVAADI